jgi:hypothetical protein
MLLVQVILLLLLFKRKYSHLSCCNIINDPNIVPCKKKIEIIIYVRCFHVTPSMTIIFFIHSLHLAKMAFRVFKWRKFKKDVTIEFDRNKWNLLNQ